jgi:hypothetical protein
MKPHLNRKMLGMVVCACHPTYSKKHKIGELRSRLAREKIRPCLQNSQSTVLALGGSQAQGVLVNANPEFKILSTTKKIKRAEDIC